MPLVFLEGFHQNLPAFQIAFLESNGIERRGVCVQVETRSCLRACVSVVACVFIACGALLLPCGGRGQSAVVVFLCQTSSAASATAAAERCKAQKTGQVGMPARGSPLPCTHGCELCPFPSRTLEKVWSPEPPGLQQEAGR